MSSADTNSDNMLDLQEMLAKPDLFLFSKLVSGEAGFHGDFWVNHAMICDNNVEMLVMSSLMIVIERKDEFTLTLKNAQKPSYFNSVVNFKTSHQVLSLESILKIP